MTGTITEPGLYPTVTAEQYHADPVAGCSLSSSGARALLPPSCPALYRHQQTNGQAPKKHYDLGHAAHRLVLGEGADIAVVDAPDWRTKDAKQQRDDARAEGRTPMLASDHAVVQAMAAALRQHPVANVLFDPAHGTAEQTLIWRDTETGVMCRARYDWLPTVGDGHRLIIADYKTTASANPDDLARSMHTFGYHQQAAWYLEAAHHVLNAPDAGFVFVAQEKTAPYLVTIFEPDHAALRIGHGRNRWARLTYQQCTAAGHWPGYTDHIELLALPPWAEQREREVMQ